MFWSGREDTTSSLHGPRKSRSGGLSHAPATGVWLWRRESNPHLPVYETDALCPLSYTTKERLAGAEGFEPTRGLINNQVPYRLGYAPESNFAGGMMNFAEKTVVFNSSFRIPRSSLISDVGPAPLKPVAGFSVRLIRPEVRIRVGWLWMDPGGRAFFMAADIKINGRERIRTFDPPLVRRTLWPG